RILDNVLRPALERAELPKRPHPAPFLLQRPPGARDAAYGGAAVLRARPAVDAAGRLLALHPQRADGVAGAAGEQGAWSLGPVAPIRARVIRVANMQARGGEGSSEHKVPPDWLAVQVRPQIVNEVNVPASRPVVV